MSRSWTNGENFKSFGGLNCVCRCGVGGGWNWVNPSPGGSCRLTPRPWSSLVRSQHFPVWVSSVPRSRFASCQRGRQRSGARGGRGRSGPRPDPPTSRAPHTRPTRPLGCVQRPSLARLFLARSLALPPPGGRRRPRGG